MSNFQISVINQFEELIEVQVFYHRNEEIKSPPVLIPYKGDKFGLLDIFVGDIHEVSVSPIDNDEIDIFHTLPIQSKHYIGYKCWEHSIINSLSVKLV